MKRVIRPIPPDFERHYARHGGEECRKHYKCGHSTLARWIKETGVKRKPGSRYRPFPEDIAEIAAGKNMRQLAAALGWAAEVVHRRLKNELPEIYAGCLAVIRKPPPADFQTRANGRTASYLAKEYGCGHRTIKRWADETGVRLRAPQVAGFFIGPKPAPVTDGLLSEAGKAMRYLQKFGPCYPQSVLRSGASGYRYNSRVWRDEELIAEALRRGWKPDGWRDLAA